jgi:hypothetical protein
MVSLKRLLEDMSETSVEKEASVETSIPIEKLKNTAVALEKLSTPDREVDVMAKLAVLNDMGMTKEANKAFRQAYKNLWKAQDAQKVVKLEKKTQKILKETERIQKGRTLSDFKVPALAGTAALGSFYLGSKMPQENKKEELRSVAKKYFTLGRNAAGGV